MFSPPRPHSSRTCVVSSGCYSARRALVIAPRYVSGSPPRQGPHRSKWAPAYNGVTMLKPAGKSQFTFIKQTQSTHLRTAKLSRHLIAYNRDVAECFRDLQQLRRLYEFLKRARCVTKTSTMSTIPQLHRLHIVPATIVTLSTRRDALKYFICAAFSALHKSLRNMS